MNINIDMSALHQLYQDMIIDHGRKPRNFHVIENANHLLEGFNPLCGDRLTVYIIQKENLIQEISFQGSGCAISIASASLMTEAMKLERLRDLGATLQICGAVVVQLHDRGITMAAWQLNRYDGAAPLAMAPIHLLQSAN